jgi:NAD(P)-dependent dehydrogenase (short-subunit alcohol dehydrogenase family)
LYSARDKTKGKRDKGKGKEKRERENVKKASMSNGQRVIVTGATSGIGRAAALRFARAGSAILAVGRDDGALGEVAAAIEREGGSPATFAADVTAPDAPQAIVRAAVDRLGGITTLVNAAGVIGSGSVETTNDEEWDAMMDINARAPFRLMRAAVPALAEARGSVVNVSSVTGLRAFPGVLAYCVSKAAVDQLTRCAALELAPRRVRVNAVNPGVVISNLHRRAGMDEERYAAFLARARNPSPRARRRAGGDRGADPLPRLRSSRLDHGGDDFNRWGQASHVREVSGFIYSP